jgi:AraC family transcriptional regulator, arabinose operon regulatory protein
LATCCTEAVFSKLLEITGVINWQTGIFLVRIGIIQPKGLSTVPTDHWDIELISTTRSYRTLGRTGREESIAAGYVVSPECNYEAREKSTPFYTILYLLEGAGEFVDQRGRSWPITPGTLVQRFPNEVHTVLRSRDLRWVEFFLTLPASLSNALTAMGCINPSRPLLRPGVTRLTLIGMQTLIRNTAHDSGVTTTQVVSEAHSLLAQLIEADREQRRGTDEATVVRRAQEQMSRNLDQRLDMPAVAAELGVGYETFRKVFRRYQGTSPKEYRIRRRIDQARHLLQTERLGVKEVSERLGYPDAPSFVKQFRRVAGITPARFRRAV